jgi:ABC-type phosphate transport system substrate-binding protein
MRLCPQSSDAGQRVLPLVLIVVSSILSPTAIAAKDMAVVCNKSNVITAVTMPELVKICKGQTNRWGDGKPITLFTRDPAAPDMKLVLEKIYGIPKSEVIGMIAAANHGRINHPAIILVDSDEALLRKVESLPGAVGLVDVYSINSRVAVVRVNGKLPFEAGYPLHGN